VKLTLAIFQRRSYIRQTLLLLVLEATYMLLPGASCTLVTTSQTESSAPYSVFGVGWTADSLANLEVGRFAGRMVSYRFRAARDGAVSTIRVFFIFRKLCDGCYANGNGGSVNIDVVSDDGSANHFPSRNVLGSVLVRDPLTEWNRLLRFPKPVKLESGKLYHIVFSNPTADPQHNYVSVDDLYTTFQGSGLQPSGAASELAVLLKSTAKSGWELKPQHVPIVSINYDDGYQQGQGYMDVKHNGIVVNPGESVREVFRISGADRAFKTLAVRLEPMGDQGNVQVKVENESGEDLQASSLNLSNATSSALWKTVDFPKALSLSKGSQYSVVLSAENGARFRISPLQKGKQYGFNVDSLFASGRCEVRFWPIWIGCLGRYDLDLPFYFR
jgi:hypothetical protein